MNELWEIKIIKKQKKMDLISIFLILHLTFNYSYDRNYM